MAHLLQRHTLPIKAQPRASLVLAYAIPADVLRPMLAPGLALDTYGDFGFLAIALVETRDLRPAFLPAGFGLNFFLAGYRIFTRYRRFLAHPSENRFSEVDFLIRGHFHWYCEAARARNGTRLILQQQIGVEVLVCPSAGRNPN